MVGPCKPRKYGNKGFAIGQYFVGLLYFRGEGVTQNYETAFKWLSRAAEQEYIAAMNKLGSMHSNGLGVPIDYAKAVTWYKKSLKKDWDDNAKNAMFELGMMNYEGKGFTQDYVRAHMWWNIASSEGHEQARKNRDILANKMTPNQLEKAQELAKTCRFSFQYKRC